MKKYLSVILILLFLTGCSAEYNIKFNKDMSIKENVIVNGNSNDTVNNFNYLYSLKTKYLSDKKYTHKIDSSKMNITIDKNYQNYKEYLENSDLYTQYFEHLDITEDDNLVSISTSGKYYVYVENPSWEKYLIDNTKINISLPFEVISNNADMVNEKENVYTWIIDSTDTVKKIELTFDKSKVIFKISDYYIYIAIVGITLLAIISFFLFKKFSFKNNQI